MFKALAYWFSRSKAKSLPASDNTDHNHADGTDATTTDLNFIDASPAQLIPYDENLLERSRTQWQFGDWASLAKLEQETLQYHPDRAKLALLVAASYQQLGNIAAAHQFTRLAQDWGCSKKLISQILIAGVHNTLGRAAASMGKAANAHKHFETAISLGAPKNDTYLLTKARTRNELEKLGLPLSNSSKSSKVIHTKPVQNISKEQTTSPRSSNPLKEKIFWWSKDNQTLNVGDDVSPIVVEHILKSHGVDINASIPTKRLLAIGSILHFAQDGDCIWGSGINGKIPAISHNFKSIDVRAVRGPLTRNFLLNREIDTPEIYGDPAILLPLILPRELFFPIGEENYRVDFLIIPHMSENLEPYKRFGENRILSPSTPAIEFIKKLLTANLVVSSSLHGIIIAEAYGIPAIWLKGNNKEHEIKYKDYYLGSKRNSDPATGLTVDESLKLAAQPILNLTELQSNLIGSFPIDIWKPEKPNNIP